MYREYHEALQNCFYAVLKNTYTRILYEKEIKLNLSGNEVYYTAFPLPVILKNSCGEIHCQNGFDLIIFSYMIR